MIRVALTGSESTGKTTLAAALAREYGAALVPEYARRYAAAVAPRPLAAADVEPIARGQLALEDAALATAAGLVVLDTDLVSTVAYARHYYGACPAWIERAARERLADRYLLLHPDVPWVADPARDQPHARAAVHARFAATLAELGAAVVPITGPWPERTSLARAAVEGALR